MLYLFDIVSHIISISFFFFLLVSKSIIFLTYMIKYMNQQKKKREKKGETLLYRAKIDTLPTLQKKKSAVLVVRILECVHSLHSLIS